jgi:nucleoside-diphosphate-sugar epimerase
MNNQTPQTPQTALVTGATGFLGTHLCNQLLKQGWQVYALCRSQDKAKALTPTITIIIGDVLDTKAFQDQLPKKIDAIFHTAASTNTWFKNNEMQTNTNINGTRNMLDLALKLKVEK